MKLLQTFGYKNSSDYIVGKLNLWIAPPWLITNCWFQGSDGSVDAVVVNIIKPVMTCPYVLIFFFMEASVLEGHMLIYYSWLPLIFWNLYSHFDNLQIMSPD